MQVLKRLRCLTWHWNYLDWKPDGFHWHVTCRKCGNTWES